MLTGDQRAAAERLFRAHGYEGPLRIARLTALTGDDERVFVVPAVVLASLPEGALTVELQQVLGRKVWLVADGPAWADTEPLR